VIAAITAGGRVDSELAHAMGTTVKALAPIGTSTPLEAAISGARAAGAERVVVIGGDEVRARVGRLVDDMIEESSDGRANIRKAIGASGDKAFLLLASDMPFLTDIAITQFVLRATIADVALPLASGSAYERAYPGAPVHVTQIGRERIANGSIVYFGPGVAPKILDTCERLFSARKSLLRMAALLGPRLLVRYVMGRLAIDDIEARATQLFGIRARAIRDSDPALCFDIDTIADYRYACERADAR
jgi:CTP:molybdopterin cytidylyltransferase MocA